MGCLPSLARFGAGGVLSGVFMYPRLRGALLALLFPALLCAQEATTSAPEAPSPAITAPVMETVVVSGAQPGPGLWRVSDAQGHVLHILGTVSPLPEKMTWLSAEVEEILAGSQEVLMAPSLQVNVERNMFRIMLLVPAMLGARNNPDRKVLKDILPPDLYAHWLVLKKTYIGRSKSIERRRPILAAQKLYEEAIEDADLTRKSVVYPLISKRAKALEIPQTQPSLKIVIEHPRAALKELSKSSLDDVECFAKTLEHVENDVDTMTLRANAWATGDIDSLRELPFTDPGADCIRALLEAPTLQAKGLGESAEKLREIWLAAAELAMKNNASTFALLPMGQMLKPDGYLADLRAKGYDIEEP